jgi:hypothetical protein
LSALIDAAVASDTRRHHDEADDAGMESGT